MVPPVVGMISAVAAERPVSSALYWRALGVAQTAANAETVAPHCYHSCHLHSACHSSVYSMLLKKNNARTHVQHRNSRILSSEQFSRNTYLESTDSVVVVGILLADFVAMVVAAHTAGFATKVDAATTIVVEILFDLAQTFLMNHSDSANGFQALENRPNIML